jgi:deoxyinosine 3'endonuclease (endonuclease V)
VLAALRPAPDVLIYDGHGLAQPRRFCIARHVGAIFN